MANRWQSQEFKKIHPNSKLLFIYIGDNLDRDKQFELSMKMLRIALNPLTDAEIKTAFKEIEPMLTFSHDRKKVSIRPLKSGKVEQGKLLEADFKNPSLPDIEIYFMENGSTKAIAKKFFNFYESKDWKIGKNRMSKWRSAASNFIDGQQEKNSNTSSYGATITFN